MSKRNPKKIFTDEYCEEYKRNKGYFTINECELGRNIQHPFGSKQYKQDNRLEQFQKGVILDLWWRYEPKRTEYTGKKFKILEIKEGGWHDFKSQFNDYILVIKRVE